MGPKEFLESLLVEWPLNTVGLDVDINGGDVVEWLATLRRDVFQALGRDEIPNAEPKEDSDE